MRPIFPGKEAWIAGFFGLIHGLAFTATLDRLGFGLWDRLVGILAFNLGIVTMQMLVVAALLPSLMLLSRTKAYSVFRIGGAVFAGAASVGWIVERLFGVQTPVDGVVGDVARYVVWIDGGLLAVSLACCFQRMRDVGRPCGGLAMCRQNKDGPPVVPNKAGLILAIVWWPSSPPQAKSR